MPNFARLFRAGQATVVHATATGYRERSHFDGQDVLESGHAGPGFTASGWLNRALAALPPGERVGASGLAVGAVPPLVIRGPAPVLGWAPQAGRASADDDLARRVLDLYARRDPVLGTALAQGLATERMASADDGAERDAATWARPPACARPQKERRGCWRPTTARGSRPWPSTVGTRM